MADRAAVLEVLGELRRIREGQDKILEELGVLNSWQAGHAELWDEIKAILEGAKHDGKGITGQ